MGLRTLLIGFIVWGLYPLWLLAGAGDYLCHRRTAIERTSGATESLLHLAQFLCMAIVVACAALLEMTLPVLLIMLIAVLAHSAFAYADVAYTNGRRYISAFEQQVHGYMEVIPLIAVFLIALLSWPLPATTSLSQLPFELRHGPLSELQASALLGSFLIFAGVPIIEELARSCRTAAHRHSAHTSVHVAAHTRR